MTGEICPDLCLVPETVMAAPLLLLLLSVVQPAQTDQSESARAVSEVGKLEHFRIHKFSLRYWTFTREFSGVFVLPLDCAGTSHHSN